MKGMSRVITNAATRSARMIVLAPPSTTMAKSGGGGMGAMAVAAAGSSVHVPLPRSIHRHATTDVRREDVIVSNAGAISDLYNKGLAKDDEVLWRRFPLDGGPRVVKARDEAIPTAHDGGGEEFDHGDTDELMNPTQIEDAICKSRFIDGAVVVCEADRPYNVALVVPDWDAIRVELGMPAEFITEEGMAESIRVRDFVLSEIKWNCYKIDKSMVPADFAFVSPFPTDRKREHVIESNGGAISDLYERGLPRDDEVRWRRFPLDGGPRVVKVRDEAIPPAHDGGGEEFDHGDTGESDPKQIEDAICKSRFIDEAVVVCGADRPYNVALVVPDWDAIRIELGMPVEFIAEEEMAKSDAVRDFVGSEIKRNCYSLDKSKVPADFAFVAPFTAK